MRKKQRCSAVFVMVILLVLLVVLMALIVGQGGHGAKGGGRRRKGQKEEAASRDLRWPAGGGCYPPATVKAWQQVVREVRAQTGEGFGPAGPAERAALEARADQLSRKGVRTDLKKLLQIRSLALGMEGRRAEGRAAKLRPKILAARRRGRAVVAIAEDLKLPPMAVLRQISGRALPPDLARELPAIQAADLGSAPHQKLSHERAQAFEEELETYLRGEGLAFRTESDLRAEGAWLTPDILLDAAVRIDGSEVRWLDAKNYPGVDADHLLGSARRQIAKYVSAFGPGAVVFAGGVMCGSRLAGQGALLLDGSQLQSSATSRKPRPHRA